MHFMLVDCAMKPGRLTKATTLSSPMNVRKWLFIHEVPVKLSSIKLPSIQHEDLFGRLSSMFPPDFFSVHNGFTSMIFRRDTDENGVCVGSTDFCIDLPRKPSNMFEKLTVLFGNDNLKTETEVMIFCEEEDEVSTCICKLEHTGVTLYPGGNLNIRCSSWNVDIFAKDETLNVLTDIKVKLELNQKALEMIFVHTWTPQSVFLTQLLEKEEICDFSFVGYDSSEPVMCQKAFIANSSDILADMLKGTWREVETSQFHLNDASREAVVALVRFIYLKETSPIFSSCKIALQLLKTSHMWNFIELKETVKTIFAVASVEQNSWYTVDDAVNTYSFTTNIEEFVSINHNFAKILARLEKMNCNRLDLVSPAYKHLMDHRYAEYLELQKLQNELCKDCSTPA